MHFKDEIAHLFLFKKQASETKLLILQHYKIVGPASNEVYGIAELASNACFFIISIIKVL